MRTLFRLFVFARKYWGKLLLAFIFLLATTGFSLAVPWLLRDIIDTVISQGDRSLLVLTAAGIVVAIILRGITAYGNNYLSEAVSQQIVYDIRSALYDHLQRLSFAYHDRTQTGQLMSRATADVEAVRMSLSRGILGLVHTFILFGGISYILISMNWKLALLSLSFIPVIGVSAVMVSRRLRDIWFRIQTLLGVMGTTLEENLTGVKVVKAFSRHREESQKFSDQANQLYHQEMNADRQISFNMPLMVFLISLPIALILWYGGRQVIAGTLTIGGLTQFIFYFGLAAMPIRRLGFITNLFSRSMSAGERILEILDAESPVQEKAGAIELKGVRGEVAFENVSFNYDSTIPMLKNISFKVSPGTLVALAGSSGSGKSTVAHLIPRFYDVSAGAIRIDGTDIREVTLESLRRNVGIVQQDIFLFSATIKENIAYGAVSASMEQIAAAAKAAHLHDFIESLPEGYDTWVGERGITLSGGEKQRLAIARTLLTNPRILIMDDSTSSLDAETEYLIRHDLEKLIKGRTTFIITHRLPVIRNADLILVLEDGQIVASGKHSELMAKDNFYRKIYEMQLATELTEKSPAGGD